MKLVSFAKRVLKNLAGKEDHYEMYPPGHYYCAIPALPELRKRRLEIFSKKKPCCVDP